ncbi:ubiquitin-conjugating enzyme E2 [Thraustotheca clavata]|uniref:E2 ubiquitin-conjugating enzyme n=1 Tax=Thraustotheca clavata TaxID=74557 RepID=A0A1V9ZND7_9STRA|nr:ubiquitin-conjugating enzyme E2 [Thraustotheca clavata]
MAPSLATTRLRKEYVLLKKTPVDNIEAVPLENNILEWHYVIRGVEIYEGGFYHGKLVFPQEYPMKPPAVYMITPNGRFKPNTKLCLSMSDFHPETWNPMWSVGSILTGLYSFMNEDTPTTGSIEATDEERQELAATSLAFNCSLTNPTFRKVFPHLVELNEELQKKKLENATENLTLDQA